MSGDAVSRNRRLRRRPHRSADSDPDRRL